MNSTVILYRLFSDFRNVPDTWSLVDADVPGRAGVEYELPEGYEVAENQFGEKYIYPPTANQPCTIVTHSSGRPQLLWGAQDAPVLREAGAL
jgi:hypothetical protein